MEQSIVDLMLNPLVQDGRASSMIRLILAECACYGMPPQIIATLDDVAAMLGYYEPLPTNTAAQLSGPLIQWRTDRRQPTHERVDDVERLAFKQRALAAFGGGPAGHRVGTAEIVVAMGNCHREFMPDGWFDLFAWAATDVEYSLSRDKTKEAIFAAHKWPVVSDDQVLKPDGRLNTIYLTIATEIRRTAIASLKDDPDGVRARLQPLGEHFLRAHIKHAQNAAESGDIEGAEMVTRSVAAIRSMFPGLDPTASAPDGEISEDDATPMAAD